MEKKVKVVRLPQLLPYEKELDLKWQVRYVAKKNWEKKFSIFSNPQTKTHFIHFPWKVQEKVSEYLFYFVHELIHACLGERIDSCFATTYFTKPEKNKEKILLRGVVLTLIEFQLNLWVNDVMNIFWPKLLEKDYFLYFEAIEEMIKGGKEKLKKFFSGDLIKIMELGLALASRERYHWPKHEAILKMIENLERKEFGLLMKFWDLYLNSPYLTYRKEDVKTFEKRIREACKILNLPVTPRLIPGKYQYKWEI